MKKTMQDEFQELGSTCSLETTSNMTWFWRGVTRRCFRRNILLSLHIKSWKTLSKYLIVSVLGQALLHSLLRSGSITIYSAPFWLSFFFRKSGEISFPPPNDQQCLLLFLENSNNNNHMTSKHVLVFCFVICIGFWKVPYGKRRKYRSRGY